MAPRNTSGTVAAAVAAAAVVAGASAQGFSGFTIPTFPGFTGFPTGFTVPTFPGVPAFNPASLPSLPTFPGFPDIPSWMVASTIAGEAGIEIPSIPSVPAFGEFEFPTLTADSTMLDIVGTPADLEGIAACSALWVPGNVETCTTAYTEGLTAYSEYLQGVAQLPVADVLAIEGLDYSAFVDGSTQMTEAWTPAMAGATFSG